MFGGKMGLAVGIGSRTMHLDFVWGKRGVRSRATSNASKFAVQWPLEH